MSRTWKSWIGVPLGTATIHMQPSQRARLDRPARPVRTKDRLLDHRPVRFNTWTATVRDRDQSDIARFLRAMLTCQPWL